jgi:hypothetical protein
LRPKIRTIYGAIYRGFLYRIVVGKGSNTFLVCIELYLMKIQKKSGRGKRGLNGQLSEYDNGFESG